MGLSTALRTGLAKTFTHPTEARAGQAGHSPDRTALTEQVQDLSAGFGVEPVHARTLLTRHPIVKH